MISLSSTSTDDEEDDGASVYSDCDNGGLASGAENSESEDFFMVPIPSCFDAKAPLDESLIEMKVFTRTSSISSETTLDDKTTQDDDTDTATHGDSSCRTTREAPVEQSMISSSRFVPANTQSVLDRINSDCGRFFICSRCLFSVPTDQCLCRLIALTDAILIDT